MSSSALPYKRTPPTWLKTTSLEVSISIVLFFILFWIIWGIECFFDGYLFDIRLTRVYVSLLRRVLLLLKLVWFWGILMVLLKLRVLLVTRSFVLLRLMVIDLYCASVLIFVNVYFIFCIEESWIVKSYIWSLSFSGNQIRVLGDEYWFVAIFVKLMNATLCSLDQRFKFVEDPICKEYYLLS